MIMAPPKPSIAEINDPPKPIRKRVMRKGQSIIINLRRKVAYRW